MKVQSLDPNSSTPELLANQLVEYVANEKVTHLITIVGKQQGEHLLPQVAHTNMSLEQLLYLRNCLDVHIRARSDETLARWLSGQP